MGRTQGVAAFRPLGLSYQPETARNSLSGYTSCVALKCVGRLGDQGSKERPTGHKTSWGHAEPLPFPEEHTEDLMADQRRRARTRPDQQDADSGDSPTAELTADEISARIAKRVADLQRARDEYEEAKLVTHHTMEFEVCR